MKINKDSAVLSILCQQGVRPLLFDLNPTEFKSGLKRLWVLSEVGKSFLALGMFAATRAVETRVLDHALIPLTY